MREDRKWAPDGIDVHRGWQIVALPRAETRMRRYRGADRRRYKFAC